MKISLLINNLLAFGSLTMMIGCNMSAGDFAGALAQGIDSHNRSMSYGNVSSFTAPISGYNNSSQSYGSSSGSSYSSDSGERYTGVSRRMSGDEYTGPDSDDSESDSGSSYADGVKAFEAAQMAKVAALRNRYEDRTGTVENSHNAESSNSSWSQKHTNKTLSSGADNWTFVGDFEGVRIWWKYRKELKDQYESALKMENMNSYDLRVSYDLWFTAADGSEYSEGGGSFIIRAGAVKDPSNSALFYYVRDSNGHPAAPPLRVGVKGFCVKRE